tara:strand:+ start:331 stop:504 length:174 start_codon:yes stop_codon:yes gene_type:complete
MTNPASGDLDTNLSWSRGGEFEVYLFKRFADLGHYPSIGCAHLICLLVVWLKGAVAH